MTAPAPLRTFAPAIARVLERHPDLLHAVNRRERPGRDALLAETRALADAALVERDTDAMAAGLRRIKYRVVGALILDDLEGGPPLVDAVGATLADLADALLDGALRYARGSVEARSGPIEGLAPAADIVSIGMGKHGAGELNYSSDIDIVWVARALPGESRVHVDRIGRRADKLLSEQTIDGLCFRVDLNLRPEGRTGPPTVTLAGAESYFLTYGRTWERAAWLKARPAAGDHALGDELLACIEPFRFRRHLDFGTLEDLATMRDRIAASARRETLERDLKRGPGGIREIEFLVQATQLAWCGRDRALRMRGTVPTLRALGERGVLPDALDVEQLVADYRVLRAVEHRIQWEREAQTQRLPLEDDDSGWERLARSMGADSTEVFRADLADVRARVEAAWSLVFSQVEPGDALTLVDPFATVDERTQELETLGFEDPAEAATRIERLAEPDARRRMRPSTWRRFERVMPQLATLAARSGDPDGALARVERFVNRVGARGTTYELLHENPHAMETLIRLFADSAFLSERFLSHPELLDTLVLRGRGGETRRRGADVLAGELLAELAGRDEGERLLAMRTFLTTELLRIGLDDLAGALPSPGLPGPWITAAAEATIRGADLVARDAMASRHGVPRKRTGEPAARAIVGFGSLGSSWMSYGSDVDLVFVYDGDLLADSTDGRRPVDPRTWAARQAQRVVTALTAQTREGRCFDVDLRLRPGGGGGGVVVTLDGLGAWYRHRAELWERIAACRARVVAASDPAFGRAVQAALLDARHSTDAAATVAEARAMRRRQREELSGEGGARLNLKVGDGSIADVEFAVACAQLTARPDHPARTVADPREALLHLGAEGDLSPDAAGELASAYLFLRRVESTLRLRTGTDATRVDLDDPVADRVAAALGLGDRVALAAALGARRAVVSRGVQRWLDTLATRG